MSDDVTTAATIASLRAEVERLKAAENDARNLYLKYRGAFGLLVADNNATFDSINDSLEATGIVFGDDDDYEDCIQRLAKERDERNAYAERLLAENVQLTNRQSMDREEIESMGKRNDELRQALDTARERAGVLEAEVRAWRDWKEQCEVWPPEDCTCEDKPRGQILATAMAETDRTHALDAAKFGGAT